MIQAVDGKQNKLKEKKLQKGGKLL